MDDGGGNYKNTDRGDLILQGLDREGRRGDRVQADSLVVGILFGLTNLAGSSSCRT